MWTRKQHEEAAQKIGEDFLTGGEDTTINSLAVKVAENNHLNPESIRTVVRLANVAVFEGIFSKRASTSSEDRMIDFQVGDPELVIQELHKKVAKENPNIKTATYDATSDFYGDLVYPKKPLEKTATAIPGIEVPVLHKKMPSKAELRLLFKRAEDRMHANKKQAQMSWLSSLEKASALLISQDSRVSARTVFEKNAVSTLGESALPELRMLQTLTSPKGTPITLFGGEKIAEVLSKHIASIPTNQKPIIELLKVAETARKDAQQAIDGLQWISANVYKVK